MLKNVLLEPQANPLIFVIERPYNLISGLTTKHSSRENYLYYQWNSLSALIRSLVQVKFPHHGPERYGYAQTDMDMSSSEIIFGQTNLVHSHICLARRVKFVPNRFNWLILKPTFISSDGNDRSFMVLLLILKLFAFAIEKSRSEMCS